MSGFATVLSVAVVAPPFISSGMHAPDNTAPGPTATRAAWCSNPPPVSISFADLLRPKSLSPTRLSTLLSVVAVTAIQHRAEGAAPVVVIEVGRVSISTEYSTTVVDTAAGKAA